MRKYLESCRYKHTQKIVEELNNNDLLESVCHYNYNYINPDMDCIKIKTENLASTIPISNKETYVRCFFDSSQISIARQIFPCTFSDEVKYGLIIDIRAAKEKDDDFNIIIIDNKMFVNSYYETSFDISDLLSYMKDTESKAIVAINRIESSIHKRQTEEKQMLNNPK